MFLYKVALLVPSRSTFSIRDMIIIQSIPIPVKHSIILGPGGISVIIPI